jgi:hypothetical protein
MPGRIDLLFSGTEIVLSVLDFLSNIVFSWFVWLKGRCLLTSIEESFLLEIKFPMRDLMLGREFNCSA